VMAGEHHLHGFRARDLRAQLYDRPAPSPEVARRRCARTSRLIGKLRSHRLLAKVQGQRLHRLTARGQRVIGAVLRFSTVRVPSGESRLRSLAEHAIPTDKGSMVSLYESRCPGHGPAHVCHPPRDEPEGAVRR
jgi:hypothetical protein